MNLEGAQWHSWGVGHDTYYDILGVSPVATQDEIKVRYRTLIRKIHPDFDVPAALFRQVQEAHEVLSDPVRRAAYDRLLGFGGGAVRKTSGDPNDWRYHATSDSASRGRYSGAGSPRRVGTHLQRRRLGTSASASLPMRHPSLAVAMAGAVLILLGSALNEIGIALILLGAVGLIAAGVVELGVRGEKERQAYQRSGMTAVDAMTGRQFEVLLKNLFANKGYWVARIGGRGDLGAGLLLNDAHGRTIVQARWGRGVVQQDAIEQTVAAMTHYRVIRGIVVTSSEYSQQAVAAANSNGVTLWNRATLAAELTAFRGQSLRPGTSRLSSELRAGSRICLGFFVAACVTLIGMSTRARRTLAAWPD